VSTLAPPKGVEARPPDLEEARTLVMVALVERETGRGPSWSALAAAMRWPQAEREQRIRALRACGLRWRRGEEGSLNVPPEALAVALEVIAEARAEEAA
jgi:hypothetical protein